MYTLISDCLVLHMQREKVMTKCKPAGLSSTGSRWVLAMTLLSLVVEKSLKVIITSDPEV